MGLFALFLSITLGAVSPAPPLAARYASELPGISYALPAPPYAAPSAAAATPSSRAPRLAPFISGKYSGARYYGSKIGRFTTVDPVYTWQENLVDPQRWNRYAYARNNPLRYVDPDGKAVWDTVGGWANAVGSNFFLGLFRTDPYHPDFAQGQAMGDKFSLGLSMAEMNVATGGGAVLALPSGGTVAIPAVALGAHSIGQAAAATYNLSKNSGDLGSIYKVPGSATTSGKPYVGRHNKPDPAKTRRSKDGRDRTQAEVIDNYDASNVQQGRVKEQAQIDKRGLGNLDNKRNEIRRD